MGDGDDSVRSQQAAEAGADALVAQGAEAGGHRGGFGDGSQQPLFGLVPLLGLISAKVRARLIASGGISTGSAIAAALSAGAEAVQMGSAFMLCPEAGTSEAHRQALRGDVPTTLTRAFSGRLARGIWNAFIEELDLHAPVAYPEVHYLTAPLRKAARESGDLSAINLWAGEAYPLARELPAAELFGVLMREARDAARATVERLDVTRSTLPDGEG